MSPSACIDLIEQLSFLGFDDEAFWRLHHFRSSNKKETIGSFIGYCEKMLRSNPLSRFQPGGTNEQVGNRLAFVLETYRRLGISKGRLEVFNLLAETSYLAIPAR